MKDVAFDIEQKTSLGVLSGLLSLAEVFETFVFL
jgi:hypothetical protein